MADDLLLVGASFVLAALGFLLAGPLGVLLLGVVAIVVGVTYDPRSSTKRSVRNCPSCGSVVDADDDTCGYCDAELETENRSV